MLSKQTSVGPVSLTVPNLQKSLEFYESVLGFAVLTVGDGWAKLGTKDGHQLLELIEDSSGVAPNRRAPGLFHFAVLFPSRVSLGRSLSHLIEKGWKLSGAGDHLVSEALYLNDPDGNGIELYWDRPTETWTFKDGRVVMDTLPVDVDSLIAAGKIDPSPWTGIPNDTKMGHVHLKVNDVEAAGRFYCDIIGFDVMATWEQALFIAVGGYHHHLGLNAWMSLGSPTSPDKAFGLRGFWINLANSEELEAVIARLKTAGFAVDLSQTDPFVRDPSGNGVWLRSTQAESL